MTDLLPLITVLAPIILALVELTKHTVKYPNNYVPAVAVIIGLTVGLVASPFTDLDLTLRLWAGGLAGLASTGLFEAFTKSPGNTEGMESGD